MGEPSVEESIESLVAGPDMQLHIAEPNTNLQASVAASTLSWVIGEAGNPTSRQLQTAPETNTAGLKGQNSGPSAVPHILDRPPQLTRAVDSGSTSPLSDMPSWVAEEIMRENAEQNKQRSIFEAMNGTSSQESISGRSQLWLTRAENVPSPNLPRFEAPVPADSSPTVPAPIPLTIATNTPRPKRLPKPIERFANYESGGKSINVAHSTPNKPYSDDETEAEDHAIISPHSPNGPQLRLPASCKVKTKIVILPVCLIIPSESPPICREPREQRVVGPQGSVEESQRLRSPPGTLDSGGFDIGELDEFGVREQLELSRKLSERQPLGLKPESVGEPTVWADTRQALCETVPYFKMPQSGCHQNNGHVYAFLYDGSGHCREYMDTDLIIARAGGCMEQDANGQMQQKKNHSMEEAQVQAVINDIEHQNPVIVICGNKHAAAICQMPHRYCVLGWYKPVAVWAEKTLGKGAKTWVTVKYRLERLDCSKRAWYAPIQEVITEEDRKVAGSAKRKTCGDCEMESPHVYLNGWMCLNASCERFWKLSYGGDAPYGKLPYHPAFLLDRTRWQNEQEPYSVRPPVPDSGKVMGDNLTKINTRGIVCPWCGRCNHRRLWKGWTCDNPSCDFASFPMHVPVKPAVLHQPWDSVGDGPTLSQNKYAKHLGVRVRVSHKLGFKIFTYTFDGIEGKLVHAVSNAMINRAPGGPDEMFEAMQRQDDPEMDLHLQRRPFIGTGSSASLKLKSAPVEDGDFMTAFSMNYGMPYKFVAGGASLPFASAPWPVRACRADLNWASKNFSDADGHVEFNEQLVFAYMEGQKVEYHDDGESGLAARIASMSLGSKAKMMLRMKTKHYVGCSKTGVLTQDKPVPGSIGGEAMYRRRLAAWHSLQELKGSDKAAYERRRKEIPEELGLVAKKAKKAEDMVTVTLHHGDIVVMEGYEIQQYLEHKVVPEGCLRFALTCRSVLPEHLKAEERPSYGVEADEPHMSSLVRMAEAEAEAKAEAEAEAEENR